MESLPWLRLQAFLCAGATLWFTLLIAFIPGESVVRDITVAGTAGAALFAGTSCLRRWQAARATERQAWLLLAVAGLLATAAALTRLTGLPVRHADLYGGVQTGRLAAAVVLSGGLLLLVVNKAGVRNQGRSLVDAGLGIFAATLAGWVWPLDELVNRQQGGGAGQFSAAAMPFVDLMALGLALLLAVSSTVAARFGRKRRLDPPSGFLLLIAAVCFFSSDTARALNNGGLGDRLSLWDSATFLGWLLVGVAAMLAAHTPAHLQAGQVRVRETRLTVLTMAPQALLAIPLVFAGVWLFSGHTLPWLPSACLLCVVALLSMRQVLVQRDNIALNRNLEERVVARTDDLGRSERRFRSLVAHSSDAMLLLDRDMVVTWASPSLRSVFALEPSEVVGSSVTDLLRLAETADVLAELADAVLTPYATRRMGFAVQSGLGRWHETETVATSLLDDPDVSGLVLNIRDVSERQELEEQLLHQAFHDALTRLANRALFLDRVTQVLQRAPAAGSPCAVLLLDLDGFKAVNDSLGHDTGDSLLVAVANRLIATVTDADTVARLGGDEFAILAPGLTEEADAVELAARIVAMLDRPVRMGERELPVRCSVGIAWVDPADKVVPSTEDLLRNADLAMYRAKAAGGGWSLFEPSMHASLLARVQEEADLRGALERGELSVAYQPTVALSTGRIVGVEALLRWDHPLRGSVSPESFITTAENTGVIVAIGEWVLLQACRQAVSWADDSLTVAVNVSAIQLQRSDFAATVARVLASTGLTPTRLVLELTESVLLDGPGQTVTQLSDIRAHGTRVAVDDFGTGYSSLSYLARFPVDILKVDRSFVKGLGSGPEHESALVRTIVQLGHSLGLTTVAEGIEQESQLAALRAMGCTHGQGFLFARPLTPTAFCDLLLRTQGALV